jgi:glutamate-1-semialdehyde aminotransferase
MKNKLLIKNSNNIYSKAIKIIPSGTQTFSKGVTQFVNGIAPKYLKKGKGAYVWDVDNNKFLDYVMGCHPLILGYADPDVNLAVKKQLDLGSTFSLMNKLELDVAEILVDTIPCAEMVRFGKNGADATTIGVRLARAVTKRDHIAYCGYHGWHDWFIANTDLNSGIPKFNQKLAHAFIYNDLDSLEKIFKKYKDKIAIVIMEPVTVFEPKCYGPKSCVSLKCKNNFCQKNFLTEVKRITKENGSILMFDEIISGFRFSNGGFQKMSGVTPDLSSFAKAISNGIPLSAIVGKKKYMKYLDKTFFSFTYGGDCIGLAAAKICIPKIIEKNVVSHLYDVGSVLKKEINFLSTQYNLEEYISCIGYPCRSILALNNSIYFSDLELKTYIQQELIESHILWAAYHALSWSHKKKDIMITLNAFEGIFKKINNYIKNKKKLKNYIKGQTVKPVFRKVADFNSYINKN